MSGRYRLEVSNCFCFAGVMKSISDMAHFVMMAVTKSKARTYMIPLVVTSVTHLE